MSGDDDEAIDDGPGPASAVIVVGGIWYMLFVDAKFKLNNRNQARSMLISSDVAFHDDLGKAGHAESSDASDYLS